MGRVSREARLCFLLSWTQADDAGRIRGNPKLLARTLYPYDDDALDKIDAWLEELEREQCIRRYVAQGNMYIEICNWLKHQKIDKPSAPKYPGFDERSRNGSEHSRAFDDPPRGLVVGREGKGRERKGEERIVNPRAAANAADARERVRRAAEGGQDASYDPEQFEAWWAIYPRKRSKGDAEKAWRALHPDSELVERIMRATTRARTSRDWMKDAGEFIPYPASWLRAKGWLDDYVQANDLDMRGVV